MKKSIFSKIYVFPQSILDNIGQMEREHSLIMIIGVIGYMELDLEVFRPNVEHLN